MEKQISIIIPTYNMEKYIGKCLDSLLIPEFDQVEVLVVNDGSKDRSSEIAHEYAERYPNSIRVIDKENGNYGSCINAALPQCTGRYVKILDADDTFDTAAFSEFVRLIKKIEVDVIITLHDRILESGELIGRSEFSKDSVIGDIVDIGTARLTTLRHAVEMHQIAYNRVVFSRFKYKQTEGVSYSDSQWFIVPMAYCKTLCCLDVIVYKYLLGREGQTMDPKELERKFNNFLKVQHDSVAYMTTLAIDSEDRRYIFERLVEQHLYIYRIALSDMSQEKTHFLKEHDEWLKNVSPDLYEALNNEPYSPQVKYFKIYRDIRKKNYPVGYKVPFWVTLLTSFLYRCGVK